MTELKRMRNEFLMFVGLTVIVLVIGGGIVWAVYSVIGELTDEGRHILATGLVFAVFGAFVLGLQISKAHVKGVARGLDLKIGARERAAVKSPVTPGPVMSAAARFDDVLPQVTRAQIVMRTDDTQQSIDM